MKHKEFITGLAVAFSLTGCAAAKRVASVAVVESDRVADELAMDWRTAVSEQVAGCREELPSEATVEERVACLGPYTPEETDKLIAGIKVLIAAQVAVQVAVECEAFKGCKDDPDWKALASDIVTAWEAIRPYAQAIKDRK